ncbi:MAG: molybdopterin-guanine dinucleotide biosynthesis protein MobB [Aquificaceae bacterium]|nr:molybdopterin-guanine dinucleotide biosynthesis protein MobB [Aquificaceae bacterium]MCX8164952.1 molybdopterin-guanine dinucleotide biosynthesis protein MobB [Aquificaceae bacterium]
MPKVVSIVGHHNAGKTTLIEMLIHELIKRGFKVGYIKHDPKGHGITDKDGSDTDRIFKLLDKVSLLSPGKLTLWERREDAPMDVVYDYFSDCHVVILEGWKSMKGIKRVVLGELEVDGLRVEGPQDLQRVIDYILED